MISVSERSVVCDTCGVKLPISGARGIFTQMIDEGWTSPLPGKAYCPQHSVSSADETRQPLEGGG